MLEASSLPTYLLPYNTLLSTTQCYRMTPIRGRALILSNGFNGLRPGSEHDFHNLKELFEKLHFDVKGEHRDYTAKVGGLTQ